MFKTIAFEKFAPYGFNFRINDAHYHHPKIYQWLKRTFQFKIKQYWEYDVKLRRIDPNKVSKLMICGVHICACESLSD